MNLPRVFAADAHKDDAAVATSEEVPPGQLAIDVDGLSKTFPSRSGTISALENISLEIERGEFVCLVGPSGCGKSTLLAIIAGLEQANHGHVFLEGREIDRPPTSLGMVFQRDLLLEWKSAVDNVLAQYRLRGTRTGPYRERALELLHRVGLGGFEDSFPWQLSGGMRQRVAMCRALVHDPDFLLMDEPFGALDALTREQLNVDLAQLCGSSGKTVLFVTHDVEEAVFLADRVLVMSHRPGTLVSSEAIDIPQPRADLVRESMAFIHHVKRLRGVLRSEGVIRTKVQGESVL